MKTFEEKRRESIELFDLITCEVYYGLNLRIVLTDATEDEKAAIRSLMSKARSARIPIE